MTLTINKTYDKTPQNSIFFRNNVPKFEKKVYKFQLVSYRKRTETQHEFHLLFSKIKFQFLNSKCLNYNCKLNSNIIIPKEVKNAARIPFVEAEPPKI